MRTKLYEATLIFRIIPCLVAAPNANLAEFQAGKPRNELGMSFRTQRPVVYLLCRSLWKSVDPPTLELQQPKQVWRTGVVPERRRLPDHLVT